jgi:hypothetical protein
VIRKAVIERRGSIPAVATVKAYLPGNYRITEATDTQITITGQDNAGWTLDDYVIPRLASGLIFAREVSSDTD